MNVSISRGRKTEKLFNYIKNLEAFLSYSASASAGACFECIKFRRRENAGKYEEGNSWQGSCKAAEKKFFFFAPTINSLKGSAAN